MPWFSTRILMPRRCHVFYLLTLSCLVNIILIVVFSTHYRLSSGEKKLESFKFLYNFNKTENKQLFDEDSTSAVENRAEKFTKPSIMANKKQLYNFLQQRPLTKASTPNIVKQYSDTYEVIAKPVKKSWTTNPIVTKPPSQAYWIDQKTNPKPYTQNMITDITGTKSVPQDQQGRIFKKSLQETYWATDIVTTKPLQQHRSGVKRISTNLLKQHQDTDGGARNELQHGRAHGRIVTKSAKGQQIPDIAFTQLSQQDWTTDVVETKPVLQERMTENISTNLTRGDQGTDRIRAPVRYIDTITTIPVQQDQLTNKTDTKSVQRHQVENTTATKLFQQKRIDVGVAMKHPGQRVTKKVTLNSPEDEVSINKLTETINKENKPNGDRTILQSQKQNVATKKPDTACPTNLTIHSRGLDDTVSCNPHIPPESACIYTKTHFARVPDIERCKDQEETPYNLCELQERKTSTSQLTKLSFKCDLSVCDWTKGIYIERLDPSTGKMIREKVPGTMKNKTIVERYLIKTSEITREKGFPFLFVNCTGQGTNKIVAQLLTFLPSLPRQTEESWSEKINLNIVLIDSVSRAHFYRSLPKTVDYLRSVQTDPNFNAHVFDYELFQAVHGHTHECERALFDGILFPGNVSTKQRDSTPIHLDVLFGIFKRAGYQTMFLDDLCWLGYYGLRDKYKASSWEILQEKLKVAQIDSVGFTDASCAILHRLNMDSGFFNTPNDQICFNGKHQHRYLFEYLIRYLNTNRETPRSKPLFSYTSTHVSHDSRGLRVQSLDTDLKNFIGAMATKENTITMIFADHGNTYTYYQVQEDEGRREMYHPAMLVVLPKPLAQKLGENVVSNLRTNQHRLFNLFDVREGIIELANYDGKTTMNPKGIFGPISKNRTCDDLSMTASSICLCQGWEVTAANSTEQMAPAEFAIGELNNRIQAALLDSRKGSSSSKIGNHIVFGACHRLRVQEIGNVRTRRTRAGMRTTTMDIRVQSGTVLDQRELITVQVSFDEKATVSSAMELISYNRISRYGPYKQCADAGVNLKMCVCDEPGTEPKGQSFYDVVGKEANITKLHECVLGVHRSRRSKTIIVDVYEVANICDARIFTATLEAVISGIPFSTKLPSTIRLPPRTMYFVASAKTTVINGYPTMSLIRWDIKEATKR